MIKDLDELQKFLKICRKQGVKEIKFGECSVTFGDLPRKSAQAAEESEPDADGPSVEELMFFSAGGVPAT